MEQFWNGRERDAKRYIMEDFGCWPSKLRKNEMSLTLYCTPIAVRDECWGVKWRESTYFSNVIFYKVEVCNLT